jgi:membrane dipeptidase
VNLVSTSVVWDNHACPSLGSTRDLVSNLERYRTAGVNVVSLNVGYGEIPLAEHLATLRAIRAHLGKHEDAFRLVSRVDDVYRCKADRTLGVVFDVEGMSPVQGDVRHVHLLYDLGVRWMLIAYNKSNAAGGGCLETDSGLTDIGRNVIDEMNRVGMVLCLSHCGPRTAAEAIEYSRHPSIFSHSNPYGDTSHVRNVSDDLMRSCARRGGVVGLSGIGVYLGGGRDLVQSLLRQLQYVVDIVGSNHVGLGLDYVFDRNELDDHMRRNPGLFPAGVDSSLRMIGPESFEKIADGLARRNFLESEIRGILGGNWLRVASQVWR